MDENTENYVTRRDAKAREVTKVAYRPSKRQRMLTSAKADRLSGHPDRLYKGEDLRKPR